MTLILHSTVNNYCSQSLPGLGGERVIIFYYNCHSISANKIGNWLTMLSGSLKVPLLVILCMLENALCFSALAKLALRHCCCQNVCTMRYGQGGPLFLFELRVHIPGPQNVGL